MTSPLNIQSNILPDRCYICRRSETELLQDFHVQEVKQQINDLTDEILEEYQTVLRKYQKYLAKLERETQGYPQSIKIGKIDNYKDNVEIMMPRYKELQKFAGISTSQEKGSKKRDLTIGELCQNLRKVLDQIYNEEIPPILKEIDPDMYQILLNKPVISKESEDSFVFPIDFLLQDFSFSKMIDHFGKPVLICDNEYFSEHQISDGRVRAESKPISPKSVINLQISGKICGICKMLLSQKS